MKFIITYSILICMSFSSVMGQVMNNNTSYFKDSTKEFIHIQTENYFGSSQLPMDFIRTLYRGGEISLQMKDRASSNLNTLNRIGGEQIGQISYYQLKPLIFNQFGYYISAITQRSAGAQYTDELFTATFYGNQQFINDTINITQTGIHNRLYNSIQFGLTRHHIKFGISYVSIQNEMNGLIQNGGVYTSTNATQINAYADAQLISSNGSNNYFQQSAWGIALNFEFTNKINAMDSSSNAAIVAGLNGVGLQFLGKNSSTYIIDTNYLFQGIEIQSISDFSQSLLPSEIADSLTPQQINRSRIGALPFELYIHKTGGKSNSRLHTLYGMRYRSESNYSTLIYFGAEYLINKNWTAGSVLSYGGYSKFQLGAHFRIKKEKFILGVNSNNMIGWFSKNGNGMGINLSASYILK